jgi:hypothetical protein
MTETHTCNKAGFSHILLRGKLTSNWFSQTANPVAAPRKRGGRSCSKMPFTPLPTCFYPFIAISITKRLEIAIISGSSLFSAEEGLGRETESHRDARQ